MDYLSQRRADVTRDLKKVDGLDALLVTDPVNVRYLSGFTGTSAYLACTPKQIVLVTDARYAEQAAEECPGQEVYVRPHAETVDQAAAGVLAKLGAKAVGLEGGATLAQQHALTEAGPKLTFAPVVGRVERLRAVKDPGEVMHIRAAVAVAERAFRMFLPQVREQDSEKDLHDALEGYLRRAGAAAGSFPPITAIGDRSARPHARPDPKQTLVEGSKLLVDWGADLGYKSDLTRTVKVPFTAAPSRRNKQERVSVPFDEVYEVVCRAQDAAAAVVRAGVPAAEVDAAARQVFADARLRDKPDIDLLAHFTHGLGHGLGLAVHELPRVRADSPDVLQAGMVITLEPGVYFPGWGGVRVEDDFLVTKDGCTKLSSLPRDPELLL